MTVESDYFETTPSLFGATCCIERAPAAAGARIDAPQYLDGQLFSLPLMIGTPK